MGFFDFLRKTVYVPIPAERNLHKVIYDVMILDDISTPYVERALLTIPNVVGFRIIPVNWEELEIDTSKSDWKNFVYPQKWRDNLIVIFDGRKRNFIYGGGACILDEKFHRIGISTAAVEHSSYDLGLRIWHEILHTIMKSHEADQLFNDPLFRTTLPAEMRQAVETRLGDVNNPAYLLVYNMYLTVRAILQGVK
jgi:hypothetical protein